MFTEVSTHWPPHSPPRLQQTGIWGIKECTGFFQHKFPISCPFHFQLQNYSHNHRDLPHLKAQRAIKLISECGGNQGLFTANFRAELGSEVHNKIHSTPPTTQIKHLLQMHWSPRGDPSAAAPRAPALPPSNTFPSHCCWRKRPHLFEICLSHLAAGQLSSGFPFSLWHPG